MPESHAVADEEPGSPRDHWWSPAWVGAVAAVLSVLIAAIGLLVANDRDPGSVAKDGESSSAAPVDESTYYFMYGTMKPGHLRYPAIDDFIVSTAPDTIPGSLFDSGAGYPAAKFEEGDTVIQGFVLRIAPERAAKAAQVIADLENNNFRPVNVETSTGKSAIAYEYIGSTDGMTPIPDGVWDGQED